MNISTKVVPWCCGMPWCCWWHHLKERRIDAFFRTQHTFCDPPQHGQFLSRNTTLVEMKKMPWCKESLLRDARTVPVASPSAMILQLKKLPLGTLHFQGRFLNQVDGASFFRRNHLHSCDAGTLGHDRFHLFLWLQFEDSFCNQNHVGAIVFRRDLADNKMHIAVTHVEANCLLQLAKGLHPEMLGKLRLHCHHLLILQHDDLVIPRARLNDLGFLIFCPHQHSDIAGKNCRGSQLGTEAREQQAIGNTIPVALWFSTRTTFLIIGRFASEYPWHRACCAASTWNWHSGKFSWSASCDWRTPCAAAGKLDLPPPGLRPLVAKRTSTGWQKHTACGPRFVKRATRSSLLLALPATATCPHPVLCRRCSWMPLAHTCAVKLHAWFGTTRKHNHQRMNATPCPQRQNTDTFTHKPCYTQKLLHTDAFTHRRFCTQTLLRTDPLTHRSFYTQELLHIEAFTHRRFYTQTLSHTEIFTYRRFHTQMLLHTETPVHTALLHRHFFTQTLLHTDAFTHRRFYAQTLLHTEAFTHKSFYTKTLLHTDTFTHRRFYAQTLLHSEAFKRKSFYAQTLLHTEAFTHKSFYTKTLLHTDAFTHRRFYAQKLLHTRAFTHRRFYTQTLLHTEIFTHRRFHTLCPSFTQKLFLHTDAFTHRRFYTQTLSHTDAFTHRNSCTYRRFYADTFSHRRFYTQTLLHTDAFTHRRFYTQTLLHTEAFTHKSFYTKTLLHTDAFTHRRFYAQTLLHTEAFTHKSFYTQTLLHTDALTHNSFYTRTHGRFTHKPDPWNGNFSLVFDVQRPFCAKGLRWILQNRNFSSVFDVQRPFRAKGLQSDTFFRNFSSVFDVQRPFRAKGLPRD